MARDSDIIDMQVGALIGATQSALRIDGAELCPLEVDFSFQRFSV
jgi:hypothetical protein